MFLLTMLACTLGFDCDERGAIISFQQTKASHYFYYDKALESSVKIIAIKDGEEIGHSSGNYFKIGQHKFILSAAHIVSEDQTLIVNDYNNQVELQLAILDLLNDIAIFIPKTDLKSAAAINYITNKEVDVTGNTVVYAGYPADLNKSVFNGTIASCNLTSLVMQSFALPGASGSVVFDNKGMAVGVLSAVQMGYNSRSPWPQIHASLVYVNRLRQYDKFIIEELLVKWKNSR